jgi:hypothetical protein
MANKINTMNTETEKQSNISNALIKINHDIALKSLIFGMIFYVIASPFFVKILDKFLPIGFDTVVFQAVLFAAVYYLVEMAI